MNKRRLFASAMAACMLLSTMPSTALASDINPNATIVSNAEASEGTDGTGGETEAPAAATEVSTLDALKKAIESGETNIKLTDNIQLDAQLTINKNVTLDLDNFKLSHSDTQANSKALYITDACVVTIKNGNIEKTGSGFGLYLNNEANVTLENVTVTGFDAGAQVVNSTLTIDENSTVTSSEESQKYGRADGINAYYDSEIIVNGGTIRGLGDSGVELYHTSSLTLNDGTVEGEGYGAWIVGGEFKMTAGTIKSERPIVLDSYKADYDSNKKITISGGNVTSSGSADIIQEAAATNFGNTVSVNVTGGTFSKAIPTDYVNSSIYTVDHDENANTWTVRPYTATFQLDNTNVYTANADAITIGTFEGMKAQLENQVTAPDGCKFVGWKAQGATENVALTGNFRITEDITYVPVFKSTNATLSALTYQVGNDTNVYTVNLDTTQTTYDVTLPAGTEDGTVVSVYGIANDTNVTAPLYSTATLNNGEATAPSP